MPLGRHDGGTRHGGRAPTGAPEFGGFRPRLVEGRDGTVAAARHLRGILDHSPAEAIGRLKAAKAGDALGTAVEVEAVVRALRRDGYAYETVAAGSAD